VQFHFWRDAHRGDAPERMEDFWDFLPTKPNVRAFAQPLIDGMIAHLPEVDAKIKQYTENYDIGRLSAVDRNVLRLAIYEMLFREDIPPVVSINEAIELAKLFGGSESGRFVNGILDRVKDDLQRPLRESAAPRQ
jgi:N utilization substance protein B